MIHRKPLLRGGFLRLYGLLNLTPHTLHLTYKPTLLAQRVWATGNNAKTKRRIHIMSHYEIVFLIRPDVATTQVDAVTTRITETITKQSGTVVKTEQWGLRNLAYRLKKYKKAYYTMLGITMDGQGLAEVERVMKYTDDIIRFTTIKVDTMDQEPSVMMKFKTRSFEDESIPAPAAV